PTRVPVVSATSVKEWRDPRARTRSVVATTSRSSSSDPGWTSRSARYVWDPAHVVPAALIAAARRSSRRSAACPATGGSPSLASRSAARAARVAARRGGSARPTPRSPMSRPRPVGTLPDGRAVHAHVLTADGLRLEVLDLGATVHSLRLADGPEEVEVV